MNYSHIFAAIGVIVIIFSTVLISDTSLNQYFDIDLFNENSSELNINDQSNVIVLTQEEMVEQLEAKEKRDSLPERQFKLEKIWEEIDETTQDQLSDVNAKQHTATGQFLDTTTKKMMLYNIKKNQNIVLYGYSIAILNEAITTFEFELWKRESEVSATTDINASNNKTLQRIVALEHYISKYDSLKRQLEAKNDYEQDKKFTIKPVEQTSGGGSAMSSAGAVNMNPYTGSGPELVAPAEIHDYIDLEQMTVDYLVIKNDLCLLQPDYINETCYPPDNITWYMWKYMAEEDIEQIQMKISFKVLEPTTISKSNLRLVADMKILAKYETWAIGGGWTLKNQHIDASSNPKQVWLVLSKDGVKVDDKVIKEGDKYIYSNVFETKIESIYGTKATLRDSHIKQ